MLFPTIRKSLSLDVVAACLKNGLELPPSDIKDMYMEKPGHTKQIVPFQQILAEQLKQGVAIPPLIRPKGPEMVFCQDSYRFPCLWSVLERI